MGTENADEFLGDNEPISYGVVPGSQSQFIIILASVVSAFDAHELEVFLGNVRDRTDEAQATGDILPTQKAQLDWNYNWFRNRVDRLRSAPPASA